MIFVNFITGGDVGGRWAEFGLLVPNYYVNMHRIGEYISHSTHHYTSLTRTYVLTQRMHDHSYLYVFIRNTGIEGEEGWRGGGTIPHRIALLLLFCDLLLPHSIALGSRAFPNHPQVVDALMFFATYRRQTPMPLLASILFPDRQRTRS